MTKRLRKDESQWVHVVYSVSMGRSEGVEEPRIHLVNVCESRDSADRTETRWQSEVDKKEGESARQTREPHRRFFSVLTEAQKWSDDGWGNRPEGEDDEEADPQKDADGPTDVGEPGEGDS